MKKKVAVAVSGGVDSSLVAALMLEQNYEVIGLTLRLWVNNDEKDEMPLAVIDGKKMCDFLGIPHYIIDARDAFHDSVVSYFIREYANGKTPNPCVFCNKNIKFKYLLDKAVELGADYMATGHYAQSEFNEKTGLYEIHKGADPGKDQSYVLYTLTQEILKKTIFPLGKQEKAKTRLMAEKMGLPVAHKPDSQEICFLPDNDYQKFIEKELIETPEPGMIVHESGTVLGTHRGLYHYTIGQRKGLGIAYKEPLYVVKLDRENNTVVVGSDSNLFTNRLYCTYYNFLSGKIPKTLKCEGKIRYGSLPSPCEVTVNEEGLMEVVFEKPQRAITPGQSVVFYEGTQLLGGGIIDHMN